MPVFIWIGVGVFIVIGAIALVVVGLRTAKSDQNSEDPLFARLAEFTERGEVVSLEELELSLPLSERVLIPLLRNIGEFSSRFTPQKVLEQTNLRMELAGNPIRIDAAAFLASRFVLAALFGGFLGIVFLISPGTPKTGTVILTVLLFTALGFSFPQLWIQGKINSRKNEIRKAMPDALDLLTICVEAGLGFDASMKKVAEKWETQLSLGFSRAIREMQLGKTRREALRDMSDRMGLPEMTSFIAAVIQSEILGVSMANVLRIQSDQMRMKRRQRAEELAHQAPIKMLLPMAFLIFPSIMIILMVPALFQIMGAFGGDTIGGG
ncbi:MAG: type II secretion system F family protein [Anaerolineae bacterium]|nr:type II secretion system F family protein [Anaerolineae bacterium]MDK1080275.1 type II secretion system F family protein [Anaerolineae bacterium]MDK1118339.1 type II secretion system F family protein [Anaerolineae bacterium]